MKWWSYACYDGHREDVLAAGGGRTNEVLDHEGHVTWTRDMDHNEPTRAPMSVRASIARLANGQNEC